MFLWFRFLNPAVQALLATLFTWGVTAAGAGTVFIFRKVDKNWLDGMLGFAAGVMVAASFWSLLAPAVERAQAMGQSAWLVSAAGFISGGLLLFTGDRLFARLQGARRRRRCTMLVASVTLHNIPEGLAVGVAFASAAHGLDGAALGEACLLALGIGLQNFPEGTAVSLPLLRDGVSRRQAFNIGQLSGIVEPLAGVAGALLVMRVRMLLPFLLAFAAGAMIYVVVEELIPESQTNRHKDVMALFTLIGFAVMTVLDVALG